MAENYLTIKVTLTEVDAGRYRSRIESSPVGASRGPGCTFQVSPDWQKKISTFRENMDTAGFAKPAQVSDFGKQLFDWLSQDNVLQAYNRCLGAAGAAGRLRLALNILAPDLVAVPWEYLYDGNNFLLRQNFSIVRIIDELLERKAPFGPIRRLLIALANPKTFDTYQQYDAATHEKELRELLDKIPAAQPTFIKGSRDLIESSLLQETFDAFYFVGHGNYIDAMGGQLICEKDDQSHEYLDAVDLAQWLQQSASVRFIYLNSCSTATSGLTNPFAGVAQRLLRDGDVAAVVAMQTRVLQGAGLRIAAGFFKELSRGNSPERAMVQARASARDSYSWGVPAVYTYLAGPEEFDQNRIACLLGANRGTSRYAFLLPAFKMGIPEDNVAAVKVQTVPDKAYCYSGPTFAQLDTQAAWDVIDLVSRVAPARDITVGPTSDINGAQKSHNFLFGSKSNDVIASVMKAYQSAFRFHYPHPTFPGKWVLEDTKSQRLHAADDPSDLDPAAYRKARDLGVIEKIIDSASGRVYFLFAGLGDRATRGCGWYFSRHWEELLEKFGGEPFGLILEFPAGLGYGDARRLDRDKDGTPA
jgi:hypothetical protein